MDQGKLVIFSAPSGAGKTTLVRHLLTLDLNLKFSISATSRKKRPTEIDGQDYYFMSINEFKDNIEEGKYLEWEEVYKDHFYGTLISEVERIWAEGNHVIFDVDVYGGLNIKKHYGEKALAIFVMPPNINKLEERLRDRLTESEKNLQTRITKAAHELKFADKFDVIIVNDHLPDSLKEAERIVKDFLLK